MIIITEACYKLCVIITISCFKKNLESSVAINFQTSSTKFFEAFCLFILRKYIYIYTYIDMLQLLKIIDYNINRTKKSTHIFIL